MFNILIGAECFSGLGDKLISYSLARQAGRGSWTPCKLSTSTRVPYCARCWCGVLNCSSQASRHHHPTYGGGAALQHRYWYCGRESGKQSNPSQIIHHTTCNTPLVRYNSTKLVTRVAKTFTRLATNTSATSMVMVRYRRAKQVSHIKLV